VHRCRASTDLHGPRLCRGHGIGGLPFGGTKMSAKALRQISPFHENTAAEQARPVRSEPAGAFIVRNGVRCAGAHLLIDMYGAQKLNDLELIRSALTRCVREAGATLLYIYLHPFEPNGGISGVAVLAESHISIHAWPEHGYAALDIFMCGRARPERCLDVLKTAFSAERMTVKEILRGKEA